VHGGVQLLMKLDAAGDTNERPPPHGVASSDTGLFTVNTWTVNHFSPGQECPSRGGLLSSRVLDANWDRPPSVALF